MESKACCKEEPKDWKNICEEMDSFVRDYYTSIGFEMKSETSPLKYIEMKAVLGALKDIIEEFFNLMR